MRGRRCGLFYREHWLSYLADALMNATILFQKYMDMLEACARGVTHAEHKFAVDTFNNVYKRSTVDEQGAYHELVHNELKRV